eukprot:945866-Prorocentrum_minimum.AAC.3
MARNAAVALGNSKAAAVIPSLATRLQEEPVRAPACLIAILINMLQSQSLNRNIPRPSTTLCPSIGIYLARLK